jgi:hypothetical protein
MKKRSEWRPILFDGQMIIAILEGRKDVTRRIHGVPSLEYVNDRESFYLFQDGLDFSFRTKEQIIEKYCPYYVGQKLWVKETFCEHFAADDDSHNGYVYRATNNGPEPQRWKPSLFMPRKSSRISLLVTNIGLGQLGDMTQNDFLKEGFKNKEEFIELWDRKNPKDKYDDYKFVWDIGFCVL